MTTLFNNHGEQDSTRRPRFIGSSGFTLIEVVLATGLLVTISFFSLSLILSGKKVLTQTVLSTRVTVSMRNLQTQINNDTAWSNTRAETINGAMPNGYPGMSCLVNHTPCTVDGTAGGAPITDARFVLLGPITGTIFYDGITANSGIGMDGSACDEFNHNIGNDLCPLKFELRWSAICAPGNCIDPQIKINVSVVFKPKSEGLKVPLNPGNYAFEVFRNP